MAPRKKTKTAQTAADGDGAVVAAFVDLEKVCDEAWQHFQSYLENEEDSDELEALVELVRPHVSSLAAPATPPPPSSCMDLSSIRSRADLLPALLSVASTLLAEVRIAEYLTLQPKSGSPDDGKNNERLSVLRGDIRKCLEDAMRLPNPGCWSMAANFWRMMNSQPGSPPMSLLRIAQWYVHAADHARALRESAIHLLDRASNNEDEEEEETLDLDNDTLAWIECLLLNHMAGVELEDPDESDSEDDTPDNGDNGSVPADQWSCSMVEATSRFMASMLLSTMHDHDGALQQLKHLDVTHRIHPNVWSGSVGANGNAQRNHATAESKIRVYASGGDANDGFLPQDLNDQMCQVFAPDAPYWEETDYSNRGYYSYFANIDSINATTEVSHSNLIDHLVVEHLLPAAMAQRSQAENDKEPIVGYEWWVHTRPVHASLGHNLHFDTDEATLNKTGQIYHPVLSSVLYLTGSPDTAGATIVLDQAPDATSNATKCWRNVPVPNSLLVFPGNLLHGVLPCPGQCEVATNASGGGRSSASNPLPTASELDWLATTTSDDGAPNKAPHRLTFLVGFWTRRVPDLVETRLYGPCGPLPSASEYKWVEQLHQWYGSNASTTSLRPAAQEVPRHESVPCITPAWEPVNHDPPEGDDKDAAPLLLLPIPTGMLDHRYFVKDAPRCFYDALFDKDDDSTNGDAASDADEDGEEDEEDEEGA
jgi:hypothetical protein